MKIKRFNSNNNEKYLEFIYDKFLLRKITFGKIDILENYFGETRDGIKISIRIGGNIDPKYLISIIDFFKECKGHIEVPTSGEYIYYYIDLTRSFLDNLDVELDANKYNL